jgi:hypothetical protein
MRSFVVAAMLAHWAVQADAQPLSPAECRILESSVGLTAVTMRQNMNAYADLAVSMAGLYQLAENRPGVRDAAQKVLFDAPRNLDVQRTAIEAIEDLHQQLRLCAREAGAARTAPAR